MKERHISGYEVFKYCGPQENEKNRLVFSPEILKALKILSGYILSSQISYEQGNFWDFYDSVHESSGWITHLEKYYLKEKSKRIRDTGLWIGEPSYESFISKYERLSALLSEICKEADKSKDRQNPNNITIEKCLDEIDDVLSVVTLGIKNLVYDSLLGYFSGNKKGKGKKDEI